MVWIEAFGCVYPVDKDSCDVSAVHSSTKLAFQYRTWRWWVRLPEPECRSRLDSHIYNQNIHVLAVSSFLLCFCGVFPSFSSSCSCVIWPVHKIHIAGLCFFSSGLHCHDAVLYPALDSVYLALLLFYKMTATKNHPATTVSVIWILKLDTRPWTVYIWLYSCLIKW